MSRALFKATSTVGSMTMLSRVLGFVRDVIIARMFGAGVGADIFFIAFRIPNFLRRLFGEGAFSQAFIPVFSEYKARGDQDEIHALVDNTAGFLGITLLVVTILGVVFAPLLIMIFAPGYALEDQGKYDLTVSLLRITFPYIFFISLTAFAGSILNSYGRFGVPAVTPVILNLSLIGAAILFAPYFENGVTALAWGVLIGGIAQLAFQIPFLWRIKMLPRPRLQRQHAGVRQIMKLMIPAIFGSSVVQINLLIDTIIASFLITGSISWLYYSNRLVEFPLGVFGIALATVLLPSLSGFRVRKDDAGFSRTLDWALSWVFIIGVPAALGLVVLAGPMISTLFQYGAFLPGDVAMSSLSLMAYASGLLAFILIKVLAPGFYARKDMKTPVRIGIIAMCLNIVLNLALVIPLAHAGLALATSLSAYFNAIFLYYYLKKDGIYCPEFRWRKIFARVACAGLVMVFGLKMLVPDIDIWHAWAASERIVELVKYLVLGAVLYFSSLWLTGFRLHQIAAVKR